MRVVLRLQSLSMDFIVDLQGFKVPIDEFVPKEISIVEVGSDKKPLTLLLEPPTTWDALPDKYKTMNGWLTRNFHGIPWDSGDVSHDAARVIICAILQHARTVYVKGLEKSLWLRRFTSMEIDDMEDLGCPSMRKLPKISCGCPHHSYNAKYNCANENVICLKNWLKDL